MRDLLLIWGAGGHAKVLASIARALGRFDRILFLDDNPDKHHQSFCGGQVASPEQLRDFAGVPFIVAVGDNRRRQNCFRRAIACNLIPETLIHPSAIVASSANIGRGTVAMPGAVINPETIIGENCILNTAAVIEHDCRVGAHVHISPRVVLGGGVAVGEFAHVGLGAVVLPGAEIGQDAVVGAGAVVLKGAAPCSTVVGVPARIIGRKYAMASETNDTTDRGTSTKTH